MTGGLLVAALTGAFVSAAATMVVRPRRRLSGRVRPWTAASRAGMGTLPDVDAASPIHVLVLGPLTTGLQRLAAAVGSSDDDLDLRLDRAGVLLGLPTSQRVVRHRLGVAGRVAAGTVVAGVVAIVLPVAGSTAAVLVILGGVVGGTRSQADLDRRIAARRQRLQVELATATQLLAMTIRVGGGVVHALQRFASRGHGLLASDVRDVLAQHAGGQPLDLALRHAADRTPEPFVARTFRVLAAGATHGADLGESLLALGADVRTARREAMRRDAVRRRAAMLVPTIAVLAPVMLLFVAAPLPSIVFGSP